MPLVIKEQEPLARRTVFRIGGPARFFVSAQSGEDIATAVRFAGERDLPWVMLGAGSNVLVSDRGFSGVVIHPAGGQIRIEGAELMADAGVPMARAVAEALRAGLAGFEWAIGVPGTIGGSVRGNAGCFGGEMKDVVRSVMVFNAATGAIEEWSGADAAFGYRESAFKRRPELIVLSAVLALKPGDPAESRGKIQESARARTMQLFESAGREFFNPGGRVSSQEVGVPTAGSTFKNVLWSRRDISKESLLVRFPQFRPFQQNPGLPVGFLVDEAGLKGVSIGGATVSLRHANFIVNTGSATAEDVIMLIGLIKERVHRMFGILLEEEIQYVGFEDFVAGREPVAKYEAV